MAATITLTGATLGAGGLGLAAVGAVGLGLLAAAFAPGGRRRGRGRGRWRRRRDGRRYSRSVEDESEAVRRVMELIRQEDVTGCGLRLACELAARGTDFLQWEEAAILDIIGPSVHPGEEALPPDGAGQYKAARGYGESGGNCGQVFPTCPLNGTQLMQVVTAYLP